jgi:hypothetical protein
MKHSGTIRYFQDHLLEKEMVSLDKMISFIKYWDDRDGLFNEQAINYSSKLFNYTFLETMPLNPEIFESAENDSTKYHDFTQSRELFLKSDPPLVSKKAELLIEFLNFCSLRKPVLKAKIAVYQDALSEIDRVTIELLKQYHLE